MGSLIIYLKIKKNLIRYSARVAHRKSQSVQSIHLIKVLGGIDIHVWIKTQTQTGTFWIATQIGQEPVLSQNCLPSWRTWWLHDTENNHQFRVLLEVSNLLHCRQKKKKIVWNSVSISSHKAKVLELLLLKFFSLLMILLSRVNSGLPSLWEQNCTHLWVIHGCVNTASLEVDLFLCYLFSLNREGRAWK